MKPPVAVRGHGPALHESGTHTHTDLRVRYYDRMKVQRVYPLTVEVTAGSNRPGAGLALDPVVVRPIIPGAQVVPAEQRLDVSRPGEQAAFHVTPLARGRYPNPRVEILQHGRPVQAIPLRVKGVTQRLTWVLLALTVLATWAVFHYTHSGRLEGKVPYQARRPDLGPDAPKPDGEDKAKPAEPKKGNDKKEGDNVQGSLLDLGRLLARADDEKKDNAPGAKDKKDDTPATKDKDAPKKDDTPTAKDKEQPKKDDPSGAKDKEDKGPPAGSARSRGRGQPGGGPGGRGAGGPPGMGQRGGPPGGMDLPPGAPPMGPGMAPPGATKQNSQALVTFLEGLVALLKGKEEQGPATSDSMVGGSPGEVLEFRIKTEAHNDLGDDVPFVTEQVLPPVLAQVRHVYDLSCNMPSSYIWAGLVMLALTAISCFLHRGHRSSRRVRIELTAAPASPHAQETLPLGPGDARPLSVEPA
jgi:hypothetical protein